MKTLNLAVIGSLAFASQALGEVKEKIAWYGTMSGAMAEAERTQKPIFVLAARPECRGVPGFW